MPIIKKLQVLSLNFKYIIIGLASLITGFVLVIDWINPSFEDTLWPFALIGVLIAALSFLFGIIILIYKIFKRNKINVKYYYWRVS